MPRRPKPARRFPPEVLSDEEVRAVIDAARGDPDSVARTRALVALLYRSGLRLNEALSLRPKDVHGDRVTVLFAKGGRSRTVGIDPGVAPYVEAWLAARAHPRAIPPMTCGHRECSEIFVGLRVRAAAGQDHTATQGVVFGERRHCSEASSVDRRPISPPAVRRAARPHENSLSPVRASFALCPVCRGAARRPADVRR